MKVLLTQDVEKLGWLGDIVEVKDGYARNYLLPYGIGIVPTEGNVKSLAEAKAKAAEQRRKVRELVERTVQAVNEAEVTVVAKANPQGHLFGSVTEKDIAEKLREQGFEITNDMVKLAEHIKEVGSYDVMLRPAYDLEATVKVNVLSQEQAEQQAQQGEQAGAEATGASSETDEAGDTETNE